jgi:1-phosphofructokinase family hexose kinase
VILSVTLNPCIDVLLKVKGLKPNDTNRVQVKEIDAGGKGINLARVAAEIGGDVMATGFLGGANGLLVTDVMKAQPGLRHDFVPTKVETRMNVSVEDGTGKPPTTFNAPGEAISAEEWDALLKIVDANIASGGWVTLGGSIPPGLPENTYEIIMQKAKAKGAKVALDADGELLRQSLKHGPDLVKPNQNEAGRLLGYQVKHMHDVIEGVQEIARMMEKYGAQAPIAIISLGANGAMACQEGKVFRAYGVRIDVNSTIGSGDSFVAGLLTAIERGDRLEHALMMANACGAATAVTDGTEIARKDSVKEMIGRVKIERMV